MKYSDNFASKFTSALTGNSRCKEREEMVVPQIRKMLQDLIDISDEKWGKYGFRREPLKGKFNNEERLNLIRKSNDCGREYARKVRETYGDIDTYEIAKKLGLEVDYPDKPNGGGHIIFAQFVEPNKVTVFKDSVDKAFALINEEKLLHMFSGVNIEELLLAHEIFHFIEENEKEIFTRKEKIRLWKLGPIKNDSNIVCLGEIAGMAFAKELLKVPYSPYILDVFLVYLYNKEVAYSLYNEIMTINN
ncbi:hypothetical protein FDF86_10285 [Clostridium botulinum]|nr:hypothetical protein [Clostridium botulinum]NFP00858.1 hypothetical protein [Clostridium botulinum]NFT92775.1 hypothetical protein [Clostridium botulinum]